MEKFDQDTEETFDQLMAGFKKINKSSEKDIELLLVHYKKENDFLRKKLEFYSHLNSHQLRAPLVQISGLIDLLSKTELAKKEIRMFEYLKIAADNMDEMIRCINKVLHSDEHNSSTSEEL